LERRLAAILAADVAGYTALMGADEVGTLRRLSDLRREFLEPLIGEHHGRVVKLMGDGLLVEFASVVDAVTCALAWQDGVAEREAAAEEDKRLRFRIAINLGDVIVEGDDIHGDGVNIAARLEGLAEPGGICLSSDAYRQARGKVETDFEDLGEQGLKNVTEPVRVYRIVGDSASVGDAAPAREPLALPDKPSIAVLPFLNMSGDPEQEYFSDGITEDLITALSRISGLLVVARNSTMVYKGQAVDVKRVGREQGVHFVLEGSVRKGGNRVRVTAQLNDATTGHQQWAERYDRQLDDIFAVQDEITENVTLEMQVQLTSGEQVRAKAGGTKSVEARELTFRADKLADRHIREDRLEARRLVEQALGIDPDYAYAWVTLGWTYWHDAHWGWGESFELSLERLFEAAQKALELNATHPDAYALLGMGHLLRAEHDKAAELEEKAVSLAPSHAEAHALWAYALNALNKPKESVQTIKRAMRLCPTYPAWYVATLADAYRLMGKRDLAVCIGERIAGKCSS
jgi:adenylate cyclase